MDRTRGLSGKAVLGNVFRPRSRKTNLMANRSYKILRESRSNEPVMEAPPGVEPRYTDLQSAA